MIPVYFKTEDFKEPEAQLYYLVTGDGLFLVKKTGLFSSQTRASGVVGLQGQKPSLALHFGRIPRRTMERVYGFFDWAWREWRSEAILFLYYSPNNGQLLLDAPPQTIYLYRRSGRWQAEGRVSYEALPRPEGYIKLGDIHSHGSLPPYFSEQDDWDDREEGLKIVIGRLDRAIPEVVVSFVAAGQHRFRIPWRDAMEDFEEPLAPPSEWIQRVHCERESSHQSRAW